MSVPDPGVADWLRLVRVPGLGDVALRKLLTAFGPPDRVLAAGRGELMRVVNESQAEAIVGALADGAAQEAVEQALEWCRAPGNSVLTLADAAYPRPLLDMPDPPPVLFLKGRTELLSRPALAIVGSRNATAQGLANAENFARALSAAGYTVVSGLALGVDAAAHRGGLTGAGSTIAVIGTGADIVYPARNRDLAHAIADDGLIVSEFGLGTPALAANFPRRNRIISGLSRGVLVVEAAQRSGSLITARIAGEQGREVFAIPGSIHSPLSKGCHCLIKQGAKLVDSVDDILVELGGATLPRPIQPERGPGAAPVAGPKGALLEVMGYDAVGFDALRERSKLPAELQSSLLMELELEGRVAQLPGGRVQRLEP